MLRKGRAAPLPVISAAAGGYHSLALTADGEVWSWGLNNHGQLGLGGFANTTAPQPVAGLHGRRVVQLDGGEHHSLALTQQGELLGFGRADSNQLGLGEAGAARDVPAPIAGVAAVERVACGSNHCCAVTRDGDLYTWGFGEMGQLAHGEADDEAAPRVVGAVRGRVAMAGAGGQHTVLLLRPKA